VDWINLAQDRDQLGALVDTDMNLSDSTKGEEFLGWLVDYQLFTLSRDNMNAWSFASRVPISFYGFVLRPCYDYFYLFVS
jgi:hypothetical protein